MDENQPTQPTTTIHSDSAREKEKNKIGAVHNESELMAAAREAHDAGDVDASRKAHETKALLKGNTEKHSNMPDKLKSIVYGGLDGIITTFAVVSGATGGGFGIEVILVLGFSNMFADGLSMGVGDALSTKAENAAILKERAREKWELENYKEGEIKEMVEIYEEKGMSRQDAEIVVRTMAKYEDFFVDQMMVDELGMTVPDEDDNPWWDGLVTFCSFVFFGVFPLLAYACTVGSNLEERTLFGISCGLTLFMLFVLGALKSFFTAQSWWIGGCEIMIFGGITAFVSFLIGWFIEDVVISSDSNMGGLH